MNSEVSTLPRLLLIVHSYNNRAGVEEHVKVLATGLGDRYEVFTCFPEQGSLFLRKPDGTLLRAPAEQIPLLAPYRAARTEAALSSFLKLIEPDLIHVVHFVNWPLCLYDLLETTGKPISASFHDYYALTPIYTMQGEQDPDKLVSSEYSKQVFGSDVSEYLVKRRSLLQASFAKLRTRVVPSSFLKQRLEVVFPLSFEVIEYGIKPFEVRPSNRSQEPLKFGYLGSLIPQKGWESLIEAFQLVHRRYPDVSLKMYGGNYPKNQTIPGVEFLGPYDQKDLPEILPQVDVGVIPSIFAETFSIVLSEIWLAGLAVAVSDIGALGDRVCDGVNGKKFIPGDIASIERALIWFIENQDWKSWQLPSPPMMKGMSDSYDLLFRKLLGSQ